MQTCHCIVRFLGTLDKVGLKKLFTYSAEKYLYELTRAHCVDLNMISHALSAIIYNGQTCFISQSQRQISALFGKKDFFLKSDGKIFCYSSIAEQDVKPTKMVVFFCLDNTNQSCTGISCFVTRVALQQPFCVRSMLGSQQQSALVLGRRALKTVIWR